MIKLKNMAHFFVLTNFEQKEIVAAGELLLQRGNKKYYKIQDYYLIEEINEIAGKSISLRTMADHLPKDLLEDIKLKEIFLNDPKMTSSELPFSCQTILSLLALISCNESPILLGVFLSPYFKNGQRKVKPDLSNFNLN